MEQPGNGPVEEPPPTAFGNPNLRDGSPPKSKARQAVEFTALIAGLACVGWGLFLGGQMLAGHLAMALPYSLDQSIGESAAASFLEDADECTNPELVGAIEGIVARLSDGLDDEYKPLRVFVLDSEDVNAFALPGGYMFVLTGLLAELETPEELIGVLGHEAGHVVGRHGVRRMAQALWMQILISQLFGDFSSMGDLMAVEALNVASLKFGRDQERESDEFGLDLMLKVGFDPKTFPDFFTRLPDHDIPQWFSTHPDPGERAEELRAKISDLPKMKNPETVPPLSVLQGPCHIAD